MTDDQFRSIRLHVRIVIGRLVLLIVVHLLTAAAGIMVMGD
jgi:hypothetical protein